MTLKRNIRAEMQEIIDEEIVSRGYPKSLELLADMTLYLIARMTPYIILDEEIKTEDQWEDCYRTSLAIFNNTVNKEFIDIIKRNNELSAEEKTSRRSEFASIRQQLINQLELQRRENVVLFPTQGRAH